MSVATEGKARVIVPGRLAYGSRVSTRLKSPADDLPTKRLKCHRVRECPSSGRPLGWQKTYPLDGDLEGPVENPVNMQASLRRKSGLAPGPRTGGKCCALRSASHPSPTTHPNTREEFAGRAACKCWFQPGATVQPRPFGRVLALFPGLRHFLVRDVLG